MRFIEDGCDIPNDLLQAHRKGEVIWFAGAGVSQECAGLLSNNGLINSVMTKLKALPDSLARVLLDKEKIITNCAKEKLNIDMPLDNIVDFDRVWSLLLRDFDRSDIEREIAKALKPKKGDNIISSHNILAKLATTEDAKVHLVTTNFDRLFEKSLLNMKTDEIWTAPRLPDLSHDINMDGLVYLHGRVNDNYSGVDDKSQLVLSAADFGQAYLSQGWATVFIKGLIEKYTIVFLGYSANDPIMRYLLEGLHSDNQHPIKAYAFSAISKNNKQEEDDVITEWTTKGVKPILYRLGEKGCEHTLLWNTLSEWSEHSQSGDSWYDWLLSLAKQAPSQLKPYQRGQVAHMVSTKEGAKRFSSKESLTSAEWLYVFDKELRFYKEVHTSEMAFFESGRHLARENYKIDSDRGELISEEKLNYKPQEPWDAFGITTQDKKDCINDSSDHHYAVLYGDKSHPDLPPRLCSIAWWLACASCQMVEIDKSEQFGNACIVREPIVLFWAIDKHYLHPLIHNHMNNIPRDEPVNNKDKSVFYNAWCYLLDDWGKKQSSSCSDKCIEPNLYIKKYGWSIHTINQCIRLSRPYFKVDRGSIYNSNCNTEKQLCISDFISVKIIYEEAIQITSDGFPAIFRPVLLDALLDVYISIQKQADRLKDDKVLKENGVNVQLILINLFIDQLSKQIKSHPDSACDFLKKIPNNGYIFSLLKNELITLNKRGSIKNNKVKKILELYEKESSGNKNSYEKDNATPRVIPTNKEGYKVLAQKPLGSILTKKMEVSFSQSTLHMPTLGLIEYRPVLAFKELNFHANDNIFHFCVWEKFLNKVSIEKTIPKQRFLALIARHLTHYADTFWVSNEAVDTGMLHTVSNWLSQVAKILYQRDKKAFKNLSEKIIRIFKKYPDMAALDRKNKRLFIPLNEAILSPIGSVTKALIESEIYDDDKEWLLNHLEKLLDFSDDARLHSISVLYGKVNYFFSKNPSWTTQHLIPKKNADPSTIEAFLKGLSYDKNIYLLLFKQIKEWLIGAILNHKPPTQSQFYKTLTGYIFLVWMEKVNDDPARLLSDNEFHELLVKSGEEFRCEVLRLINYGEYPDLLKNNRMMEFFNDVWPRQKKVKKMTSQRLKGSCHLISIIFNPKNKTIFDQLSSLFIDKNFLVPLDNCHPLSGLFENNHELIKEYPIKVLSILHLIIPRQSRGHHSEVILNAIFSQIKKYLPKNEKNGDAIIKLNQLKGRVTSY